MAGVASENLQGPIHVAEERIAVAREPSEVLRAEARVFSDFRECRGANLFAIVETEREVRPTVALQLAVGFNLFLQRPADSL